MSRRLIVLNAALVILAVVAVAYIVRELRAPAPVTARRQAPPAAPTTTAPPPASETPAGGYGMVASRNLFSPTRTEAPVAQSAGGAASAPRPNLFGIILRDGAPVAYLEDPTTKRVAGYRLGDAVAGGTVKRIGADHVVLNRPEGDVNVRLRDPSKPRPAAPPQQAQPGAAAPPAPGAPQAVAPPGTPAPPVAMPQAPGQVGTPAPQPPQVLPRRPLPPNLLRRLPPSASDAPAQQ